MSARQPEHRLRIAGRVVDAEERLEAALRQRLVDAARRHVHQARLVGRVGRRTDVAGTVAARDRDHALRRQLLDRRHRLRRRRFVVDDDQLGLVLAALAVEHVDGDVDAFVHAGADARQRPGQRHLDAEQELVGRGRARGECKSERQQHPQRASRGLRKHSSLLWPRGTDSATQPLVVRPSPG
jgi:hypothetical protein